MKIISLQQIGFVRTNQWDKMRNLTNPKLINYKIQQGLCRWGDHQKAIDDTTTVGMIGHLMLLGLSTILKGYRFLASSLNTNKTIHEHILLLIAPYYAISYKWEIFSHIAGHVDLSRITSKMRLSMIYMTSLLQSALNCHQEFQKLRTNQNNQNCKYIDITIISGRSFLYSII